MKETIDFALPALFNTEGGFAIRDTEGGGAVNHGITFNTFKAWKGLHGTDPNTLTFDDLKALTKEQAEVIYHDQFLQPIRFDELPVGVDYAMLDTSVNNGVGGAIKILQKALGFKGDDVDGHFGLQTRWAALHRDPDVLINKMLDQRSATDKTFSRYNKPLPPPHTNRTWGQVWEDRIEKVRGQAHELAKKASQTKPSAPQAPQARQAEPSAVTPAVPKAQTPATPTPPRVAEPTPRPPDVTAPVVIAYTPRFISRGGIKLEVQKFSPVQFLAFLDQVVSKKMGAWRPRGVVLHSTYQPSLKTWDEDKTVRHIEEWQRIDNMTPNWVARGFKGGPHLFIDREDIITANPLWRRGTHSPSFNASYWGVELVGNYSDNPGEQMPESLRYNAEVAIAGLFAMLGHEPNPDTFKFHGEDPRTTHKTCPGHGVGTKEQWDRAIEARMAEMFPGEHYTKD